MAANDGMNASGNANQNGERPIQLAQANTASNNAGGNGPNVIHVAPPAPGAREDITVLPGQNIVLDGVDLATARVERVEGGLLITLADGGVIFLAGFVEAAGSANPPHVEIPGLGGLEAGQLLAAADNNISNIQPAAGPGAGPGGFAHGGGAAFGDIVVGPIGDGLNRGPLGPRYDNGRTPPEPQFALGTVNTPTPEVPPSIVAGDPLPMSVDESNLTAGTNGGTPGSTPNLALTHETVDYSTVFTTSGGTTTYALGVPGGNGSASGLHDSQTGSSIVLVLNGNTVEGHVGTTGGALAFTLAIDPNSGSVTLTQDRAVSQATASSPDTSEGVLIGAGVITVTGTVTGPGGTASATVDAGHSISFLDDGPSMFVTHQGGEGGAVIPTLSVDESNLTAATNGIDGSTPNLALTHASASFAGVFTSASGADGTASLAYSLSITGGNGAASGLTDSQTGSSIVLVLNGNTVEGHVGSQAGDLAFTISVDSSGTVTLTQDRAVSQADGTSPDTSEGASLSSNVVLLNGTITDKDGDTASAHIDLGSQMSFLDDGPVVQLADVELPTLVVDESNLTAATNGIDGSTPNLAATTTTADFSGAFGSSTPGADGTQSTAYTLSINGGDGTGSGLVDSQTGKTIVLVNNAGVIEGHVDTQGGALAFTLSVDTSGNVTLTQDRAVTQADGTSPDTSEGVSLTSGVVSLALTVTDHDGDTSNASIDLGSQVSFLDDGPSISTAEFSAPTLSVDETNLPTGLDPNAALTHATGSFAGAFTATTGADGGSTAYALTINNTASGLVDSVSGQNVVLSMNGGTVEGRTATGNDLVFTISVDAGTGDVTLTEVRAVKEATASNGDTNETVSLASGIVSLGVVVTDNDGDTASQSVDIGNSMVFHDDGPSISLAEVATPTLSVDESNLPTGSAPNATLTHTSADFSSVFTTATGADGGATTYALSVASPNVDSGLIDSVSGEHVLLSVSGGVVEGRTAIGGDLVFSLSVDSSGSVTLTEVRAVKEGSADAGSDSNEAISIGSSLVSLTATVTDNDGDFVNQSIDLGAQVSFHDDGPSVSLAGGTIPSISVDESNLTAATNGTDGSTHNITNTTAQVDFHNVFTVVQGADTATTAYSLTITGGDGATSGLTDSQTSTAIVLKSVAGGVEGHVGTVGGALAFTILVNSSTGVVTLTQDRAVSQGTASAGDTSEGASLNSGILNLVATATDKDGDTATNHVDLGTQVSFLDDGPSVTLAGAFAAPTLSVDESNLPTGTTPGMTTSSGTFSGAFTVVQGADTATTAYSLSVIGGGGKDSGLIDTATGHHVFLFLESGVIVGREGTTSGTAASGAEVFTLNINTSTGSVTLTELRALKEGSADVGTDSNESVSLGANMVSITATATDKDLDTSSASYDFGAQVVFHDDGPIAAQVETASLMNQAGSPVTAALDFDSTLANNFGADGGTIAFTSSLNNTDSGFKSGGQTIRYSVSGDGQTLTGFVDNNGNGSYDAATDTKVFTITLNSGAGTYATQMFGAIDGGSQSLFFGTAGFTFIGGNDPWAGFLSPTGQTDLLLTPIGGDTVNSNANTGGIGSGDSVGAGDAMRIDFVVGLSGTTAKSASGGYSNPVNDDHSFTGHYFVNGVTATLSNISGSTGVILKAYLDHDTDTNNVASSTDRTLEHITSVGITYNGDSKTFVITGDSNTNVVVGGHTFTITDGVDGAHISGVVGGTQLTGFSNTNYNSMEFWYESGSTFKIGNFGTTTTVAGQPVELNPTVTITDGDGDTATSTLHVNVMPDSTSTQDYSASLTGVTATSTDAMPSILGSSHNDTLTGNSGVNDLFGGAGNDTINGGGGADRLYGGSGDDLLVYESTATILDGGTGTDTLRISDATADLTALGTAGNLRSIEIIDLKTSATNTTLTVNAADVLQADNHTLTVFGSSTDTVNAGAGWAAQGTATVDAQGHTTAGPGTLVDVYTQSVNGVTATLQVEHQINHAIA